MGKKTETLTRSDVATVSAATMVAVGKAALGKKDAAAAFIERCMVEAVKACHDRGVDDPEILRDAQRRAKAAAHDEIARRLK